MDDDQRAHCATMAALLHACEALAHMGLVLSAAALLMLGLAPRAPTEPIPAALAAVLVLGLLERYLWLRIRLDQGLFEALVQGRIGSLVQLDGALAALGLRARTQGDPGDRPLVARLRGTRRLIGLHALCVAGQTAILTATLILLELS